MKVHKMNNVISVQHSRTDALCGGRRH